MKISKLRTIIREEYKNILNEAFADPNIRKLDKMSGMDRGYRSFWTKFANTHDIAWDKLPQGTVNKVTNPNQAKSGLAFWVVNGRKQNPFSTDDRIVAKLAYDYFIKAESEGYQGYNKRNWLKENAKDVLYGKAQWFIADDKVNRSRGLRPASSVYNWVTDVLKPEASW